MLTAHGNVILQRYHSGIPRDSPVVVIGTLAASSEFPIEPAQRDAWLQEIAILGLP